MERRVKRLHRELAGAQHLAPCRMRGCRRNSSIPMACSGSPFPSIWHILVSCGLSAIRCWRLKAPARRNADASSATKPGMPSTMPMACIPSALSPLFGDPATPYPASYKPHPESRAYVINLANWYAQAHPVEDFAETFAIWLNPHVDWRSGLQSVGRRLRSSSTSTS